MLKQMVEAIRQVGRAVAAHGERRQQKKRSRYTYTEGPMTFLAQQMVRTMQEMGWPAQIHAVYRSPDDQQKAFARGHSRAAPWESAHQYYMAADIIHAELAWTAPQQFWDDLRAVGQIVSDEYKVPLEFGYDWGWDLAHIEIVGWRDFRARVKDRWKDALDWADDMGQPPPGVTGIIDKDLQEAFFEMMPDIYRRWARSKAARGKVWVDISRKRKR